MDTSRDELQLHQQPAQRQKERTERVPWAVTVLTVLTV